MIKNSKFTLILLFVLVNFVQSETASSIPQLINYQGMLTNAEGQPLETKEYKLSFSIFNQPTGGEAVWGPQIFDGRYGEGRGAKVPVVRGHFNVILGDKDINGRLITDAFQKKDSYLEITVENNSPIAPRQQILSTPYSVRSEISNNSFVAESVKNDNIDITNEGFIKANNIFVDGVCIYLGLIKGIRLFYDYDHTKSFGVYKGLIEINNRIYTLEDTIQIDTENVEANSLYSVYIDISNNNVNTYELKKDIIKYFKDSPTWYAKKGGWYLQDQQRCIGFIYINSQENVLSFTQTHNKIMYHRPVHLGSGLKKIATMPKISTIGYFYSGTQFGYQSIGFAGDNNSAPFQTSFIHVNEAAVLSYIPFPCNNGQIFISGTDLYFMGFDWAADNY